MHQDAGKAIQKCQRWDHPGSIQNQPSEGIWTRVLETLWLQKNNQWGSPKLSAWQKREMLRQIKHLQEDMRNFFVRVTVRADIPSSIIAEKVVRVMQRLD